MKIYGDLKSGNCLKVRYTADFLRLSYEWIAIDILEGQSRSPSFLAINPQGQVPALVLDDGRTLAQSNAIIRFLARGSSLLPDDAYAQAKVDEWLFWEQYSHEPYIAVLRFHMVYLSKPRETREVWRVERGEQALDCMEEHLSQFDWLVGRTMTVADISLLAYTRLAGEGGFTLAARPGIERWVGDCESVLGLEVERGASRC